MILQKILMISLIKEQTGCQILVAQNGRIWISNKDPAKEKLIGDCDEFLSQAKAYLDLEGKK